MFLYHATYSVHLNSIKKNGLGGKGKVLAWSFSDSKLTYFAEDPYVAESYAEIAEEVPEEWVDDIVILKVDLSGYEVSIDPNNKDENTYVVSDIIPWERISVWSA